MHNPSTVAFEIKYPWKAYRNPRNDFEKDYRNNTGILHPDIKSIDGILKIEYNKKTLLEKLP